MATVMNNDGYRLVFILLAVSGFSQVNSSWRFFYCIYQRYVQLSFTILLISEAYILCHTQSIEEFNDLMTVFLSVVIVLFKGTVVIGKISQLNHLQRTLDNSFFIEELVKSRKCASLFLETSCKMRRLVTIMAITLITVAILWALFPLLDAGGSRRLPLPIWLPVDVTASPLYELLYACETVVLLTAALNYSAIDCMLVGFIVQNGAHYNILIANIKDLANRIRYRPCDKSTLRRMLAHCIRHHQEIINCIRQLRSISRKLILVQMVGGTLIICVAGFEVFVLKRPFSTHMLVQVSYMTIALIDLFVYCAFGEYLVTKSEELRNCVYDLPWDGMRKRDRHAVIMMLSTQPLRLSIGGYSVLGLPTYVSVLRTAYSTFSLLRQLAIDP